MEYILKSTIALEFIKKSPVTGSYKGMRYRLMKDADEIEVCIWPEPYNFIKTADELKQYNRFPLSAEGKRHRVRDPGGTVRPQRHHFPALPADGRNQAYD